MKKNEIICTMENSKKVNGLHFTLNHTGKMEGMSSLSTSVCENERCQKNAMVKGSICEKCFAARMSKTYGEKFQTPYKENTKILTSEIIPAEKLPLINRLYFRLEAFGDLNNEIQVINYFNICKKNPGVHFALWTKNPDFIEKAIESGYKKPKNLNIILSSLFINQERTIPERYTFIDKVFTVYDDKAIQEKEININCGARSCINCLKCYKKNNIKVINEKLK